MRCSIVIPAHNEEGTIRTLLERTREFLGGTGECEIIVVDDGSSDKTAERVQKLAASIPTIRLLRLSPRRGQGMALAAGIAAAQTGIIVTMDADLQNDPADIPALLERLENGFDVVCGWRKNRKDPFVKRIKSRVANLLQRLLLGVKLHDMSCTLRAYRREALEGIEFGRGYDFSLLPYLIARRKAMRICEVPVSHERRHSGTSKYGFWGTCAGTFVSFVRCVAARPHK